MILADAKQLAADFMALLPQDCYRRAVVAGSVRRQKPEVKDIEIVIEPNTEGLFTNSGVNLLWTQIDYLVSVGTIKRHLYPTHLSDGTTELREKWGDKYRGCEYRGATVELFTANEINWGAILCIRTGPANFSRKVVTNILEGDRFRQKDGNVICVLDGGIIAVPDETCFFRMAGMPYVEPEERQ